MGDEVIIIGAGIGGLSTAIRLQAAGKQVTVLEKNPVVGGKMNEMRAEGYRWDTGPTVITLLPVLEELFNHTGKTMSDALEFVPIEPLTRYFFHDGACLDLSGDLGRTLDQIGGLDERDIEGYLAYLAYCARLFRVTSPVFTFGPPPSLASFTKLPPGEMLFAGLQTLPSMDTVIRRHVHTHQLQKILGRFATYAGSSPFLSPAILSVIAHVELNMGVWYPRGGVYEIARALEKLATDLGVRIHTQTEVMAIDYERGSGGRRKIRGVRTRSGEQYRTDCVIANLDATAIQEKLLPLDDLTRRRITHLERIQPSCSGFILFLGVEGRHPKLAHHNIFFSEDYQKEFQQIFNEGRPATDPTIYLAISSKTDPSHAPDGCENWFVLVNAPSCGRIKWEEEKENYARSILHRLADLGFDIRTQIRHQEVASPDDLEVRTGARKGSLYGMSFHSRLTPFRRPANRDTEIAGLYYVGGTTHPGGGVPMVILSSKVVAEMILEGHE